MPLRTNYADGVPGDLDAAGVNAITTQVNANTTKLAGVENGADVTDAENVVAVIHAATSKATPVDADEIPLADSAASFALKKLTWANLKAGIKAYYDAVTAILSNKTLDNTTIATVKDTNVTVQDADDVSKQAQFAVPSGQTASTTRTHTLPVNDGTLLNGTNTVNVSNKALDSSCSLTTREDRVTWQGTADATKQARLVVPTAQTTGTVRSHTLPSVDSVLAPLDAALNAQTGTTYTLAAGDDGKVVTLSNASAITVTVPQNSDAAIPVGAYIECVQLGAGQVTFAAGSGATLRSRGSALKIAGQYGTAGLRKIATNEFVLTGDLTT